MPACRLDGVPQGPAHVDSLVALVEDPKSSVPESARGILQVLIRTLNALEEQLKELSPERLVYRRGHSHIRHRRRRRLDVDDEVRTVRVTGLGEVSLVATPGGAALVAVSRVRVGVPVATEPRVRLGTPSRHVTLSFPQKTYL